MLHASSLTGVLLTAILADAINLGLTKMAEACASATFARLSWLAAWHIRLSYLDLTENRLEMDPD